MMRVLRSGLLFAALFAALGGCTAERERRVAERELREAMEEYARTNQHLIVERVEWRTPARPLKFEPREMRIDGEARGGAGGESLTLGRFPGQEGGGAASRPSTGIERASGESIAAYVPADYWKEGSRSRSFDREDRRR